MDLETLKQKVSAAKETFCNGIYVPCKHHPCGWDFIDFSYMDEGETEYHTFDLDEISNGCYESHPYEDLTLSDILEKTNGRYAFELSQINW